MTTRTANTVKSAAFYRKFLRYSGGHQKVYDYFRHLQDHPVWEASIYWAEGSVPQSETIWAGCESRRRGDYVPGLADLVFLAGTDWDAYLPLRPHPEPPVINLIQHVRHADPASKGVYPFLSEKAIRICVSPEVEAAILATGQVNGPTVTIANGIDVGSLLAHQQPGRSQDVYVLARKSPELGRQVAQRLESEGISVLLHEDFMERQQVLQAMACSRISVLLPHKSEGFYLPALEAMALSEIVVVPDCVGNRSFCSHQVNCLMPARAPDEVLAAALEALDLARSGASDRFREASAQTLDRHRLEREREDFYRLLNNLDTLWP